MAVIAKLVGKKIKSTGELPLNGSKAVYDYLTTKNMDKISRLSIINYYGKGENVDKVSSTRFELVIGDSSNPNNYAISPRIIAKRDGKNVVYTVEFLATEKGSYGLDKALVGINNVRYAKNDSDVYVMDREQLLKVLSILFNECPR